MILNKIYNELSGLYPCRSVGGDIYIFTGTFIDGEGLSLIFTPIGTHECRLVTGEAFSDYFKYREIAEDYPEGIALITRRFGVTCDKASGTLSIALRRNALSVTEAICRLQAAALMICELGDSMFFKPEIS